MIEGLAFIRVEIVGIVRREVTVEPRGAEWVSSKLRLTSRREAGGAPSVVEVTTALWRMEDVVGAAYEGTAILASD